MKKNIKNLLLIMIVLLGVFTLAGCGNKYKYPTETPKVTSPDEVVLTIGDYKVTKEQMYYRNLTSYGVNVLNDFEGEKILFQNHFGTNKDSINFWLDRVDSVFVSNEITYDEIDYICKNVKKDVVLHLYGYNQVMYSRRLLLSNWSERFNIEKKSTNVISDISSGIKFRAMENEYGTVMYSQNVFNGSRLLGLDNVKYYYVNTTMVDHNVIMDFLTNKEHSSEDEDNGFLDRETIYKLKGRDK